jgi:proteasome lid subunit RPN8/RPN11
LNGDEMVFEEVSYREPHRLRRPDHDRRWACLAYQVPRPDDLPIFLDRATADAIERHALRDTSVELGGILLGKECVDDQTGRPFVWITQALEAKHYENSQASFTYTHDSWEEITRERDRQFPDLDIVGWYHTHPDFGIFLSSHDLFIHRHFFDRPVQVAYVVDPIRQDRGFFQWRGDAIDQVGGFQIVCARAERVTAARFLNDLENLPNPDGGGGGLSPRLEAELIAMLSRPHTHAPAASATERVQLATLFALLGIAFGVLAVAAGLWLYQLNRNVVDQAEQIRGLRVQLAQTQERHDLDVERARVQAKQTALDALLREIKPGASPDTFTDLYARTLRERDEAQRQLERQKAVSDQVAADLVTFRKDRDRLQSALEQAVSKAQTLEKDAQLASRLQSEKTDLEVQVKALEVQAAEQTEQLETLKDVQVGTLPRKYQIAWYAAVAGWGLSVLMALGLIALHGRTPPQPDTEPRSPV